MKAFPEPRVATGLGGGRQGVEGEPGCLRLARSTILMAPGTALLGAA